MLRIANDKETIARIAKHPKVRKWICDDFTIDFEQDDKSLYLLWEDTACVSAQALNGIMAQVHIMALPEAWGQGVEIALAAKRWFFEKTRLQKLVAFIPDNNKPAIKLARDAGMKQEGRIKEAFSKGFRLRDLIIFGMNKGE